MENITGNSGKFIPLKTTPQLIFVYGVKMIAALLVIVFKQRHQSGILEFTDITCRAFQIITTRPLAQFPEVCGIIMVAAFGVIIP
jgi:hypothetical protein